MENAEVREKICDIVPMLKELCRLRDFFCESYITGSMSSLEWLDRYFMQFSLAWQTQRHRENADK